MFIMNEKNQVILPGFRTPGGIQTRDLQNRNLTFYSAELRGLIRVAKIR